MTQRAGPAAKPVDRQKGKPVMQSFFKEIFKAKK